MENQVSDLNQNMNWSMASERRSPLEGWLTQPSEKWSTWDGWPHSAATWSLAAAEEAQAAGCGEKPSFSMANRKEGSPVLADSLFWRYSSFIRLGIFNFRSWTSSGRIIDNCQWFFFFFLVCLCTGVLFCCHLCFRWKSLHAGQRVVCAGHSSGQFSAFGSSLCPCTGF